MKRSAKGYNGTTAMSRQSPDVTIFDKQSFSLRKPFLAASRQRSAA
jgi:hypothetical protein